MKIEFDNIKITWYSLKYSLSSSSFGIITQNIKNDGLWSFV